MPNITRREPFFEWTPIGRLMEQFFDDSTHGKNGGVNEGTLALDVSENDANVIVRASLPGFSKEDVEIEIHDGVLTINATHTEESEETDERFYRKERRVGSVHRRLALPSQVLEDTAEANLADGVLTLRLPKTQKAQARKVTIN